MASRKRKTSPEVDGVETEKPKRQRKPRAEPTPDYGPTPVELTLPARLALLDAAHDLHADLVCQIGHVVHAFDFLHRGEWHEAAWSFWRAGMTEREPRCVKVADEEKGWVAA